MSRMRGSYELVDRDPHASSQILVEEHEVKSSYTTSTAELPSIKARAPDYPEEPKVALYGSFKRLLLSFIVHILPIIATTVVISLSFRNVYWFDNQESSDINPWKFLRISLNELLNGLQFVAKLHEILLVSSLAAMIMHCLRIYLVGRNGVPFGLLTAGFSVGSPEYLVSKAFRSSAFNRIFWPFAVCFVFFTVLANTVGPAAAIALIPNLDWWNMKAPFGQETLPVYFGLNSSQLWSAEVGTKDIFHYPNVSDSICFSSDFQVYASCPSSGWQELERWIEAYANEGVEANVTMVDSQSNTQRIVRSRLTPRGAGKSGVAISTSLSQAFSVMIGSFWQFLSIGDYPINKVIRPRLQSAAKRTIYQPLVQVQCDAYLLEDFVEAREPRNIIISNDDINTFSGRNSTSWPLPDWLYDYRYNISDIASSEASGVLINTTWVDMSDFNGSDISIGAIVIVPSMIKKGTGKSYQDGAAFTCSIDARWVATAPFYDPIMDQTVQHNITDPLLFQKQNGSTAASGLADVLKWGVSPAIPISPEWAAAFDVPVTMVNQTATILQWYFDFFTDSFNIGENTTYNFEPPRGLTVTDGSDPVAEWEKASAETIATVLGLSITDGLARIGMDQEQFLVTHHINSTTVTGMDLMQFAGNEILYTTANVTLSDLNRLYPASYTFTVDRYGYGYGLRSSTVIFGVAVLLTHALLALLFIAYTTCDFLLGRRWTSNAWGEMAEFAALLINSQPSEKLQNTCAGVESKDTWRMRVRIRETSDAHLGVIVDDVGAGGGMGGVRRGVRYGKICTSAETSGYSRRSSGSV